MIQNRLKESAEQLIKTAQLIKIWGNFEAVSRLSVNSEILQLHYLLRKIKQ